MQIDLWSHCAILFVAYYGLQSAGGAQVTMWPVAGMRHGQSVSDERAQRKLIQALVQASSG